MAVSASTPIELVEAVYRQLPERVALARRRLGRPLTATEKILANHLRDPEGAGMDRGVSYTNFDPDRVAMQDATAQMALLQFMTAGLDETEVPTTVHCDHLILAKAGADLDLKFALDINSEVYEFLRTVSARYGIGFWKPGSGIIHQVVLENYAFPGGMMIGTDSHTPNAGGLGMVAIGVGGADAVDVMTGFPFNVRWPKLIGVHLTGELSGWTAPKDVILRVAEVLTVKGGTGAIVEYFGPGADSISATGKGTICNMGAEIGATTSLFAYDPNMAAYLKATGREAIADAADAVAADLRTDPEVWDDPERFFDRVIEIDLSRLEPLINGPDTPDLAHAVSRVGGWAKLNGVPTEISSALVGSCTNSSYEDITRAASIARQASASGLRAKTQLLITPGSEQVRATIERDGLLADLEAIGGEVLANACGPCIGQWERTDLDPSKVNTIVNSYNRNFPKRNDGNANTKAFVTSPDMVIAYALAGTLEFDPVRDSIANDSGERITLDPPVGEDLPSRGFDPGESGFLAPPDDGGDLEVVVAPDSERLQLLEPFAPWDGEDYVELPVLMKAKGKCTTDHISAAGKWLRYRGHLENISGNLFLGVINAFRDVEAGHGKDPLDGEIKPFPEIAKHLHEDGVSWCAVGDENYGEGSSREHAAMEPRFRNGKVVFARSFARIHETNAKKQGLLPLTFADRATYDEIGEDDHISVHDLANLAPDTPVRCTIHKPDGSTVDFECTHTFSPEQIEWFRAGSALNIIRAPRRRVTPAGDGWDPAQYHRFDAERDRPFADLLALLEPVDRPALVDLGCGDGRLTVVAHERLDASATLGIDSSPAMLDKAPVLDAVRFERGDIAEWDEPGAADVILANASLHWVPDHEAVLARWRASLRPGGQLLAILPANADHPSHVVLTEVTDELGIDADLDPVAANVLLPEVYAEVLDRLGAEDQHVRLQVYAHRLASSSEVVEWVKGTTVTRIRKATDDAGYERFLARYRERLLAAIGDRAPYTYLFKRILFWARF